MLVEMLIIVSNVCVFQVAVPDVLEATTGADVLVFVTPHQFIRRLCSVLKSKIKPTAIAVSLIKVSYQAIIFSEIYTHLICLMLMPGKC